MKILPTDLPCDGTGRRMGSSKGWPKIKYNGVEKGTGAPGSKATSRSTGRQYRYSSIHAAMAARDAGEGGDDFRLATIAEGAGPRERHAIAHDYWREGEADDGSETPDDL